MPNPSTPTQPDSVERLIAEDQRDRARDRGSYNQYGMRDDPRDNEEADRDNLGNGDRPRRFGAGGDPASYTNRVDPTQTRQVPERDTRSDAPAHKSVP